MTHQSLRLQELRDGISEHFCVDEIALLQSLLAEFQRTPEQQKEISQRAKQFCLEALDQQSSLDPIQSLLKEYQLSSKEGLALLSLTEALLRIPDQAVAAQLIADRIQPLEWGAHLDETNPLLVNASSILLMLAGKLLVPSEGIDSEGQLHKLIRKLSQPIIRKSVMRVIDEMAGQFVFSESIERAMKELESAEHQNDLLSLDMLGEAALCEAEAIKFYEAYEAALKSVAENDKASQCGISIKLSALYPRFEYMHSKQAVEALVNRLRPLVDLAKANKISITLDAEEANRLEMGLDVFTALFNYAAEGGRSVVGLAVQAYGTRAMFVLKYLKALSDSKNTQIPVRLVKGAYWDTEIKQAQAEGMEYYPVFTHKRHTDLSYLVCSEYLLNNRPHFYPQFATHNAVSICDILAKAAPDESYEFQRLHGMGQSLYAVISQHFENMVVRTYGPVGEYKTLLPYLVRRMLENGANSAFVKRMLEGGKSLDLICEHPLAKAIDYQLDMALPKEVYSPTRVNSQGINLADRLERERFLNALKQLEGRVWCFDEFAVQKKAGSRLSQVHSPYDDSLVGEVMTLSVEQLEEKFSSVYESRIIWRQTAWRQRREMLERFAQKLNQHSSELVSLLIREAGKTIPDAINELREAIDFANYYAQSIARLSEIETQKLPGIAGEENTLHLEGRGVFLCISPWNFPLAIFSGQVCAALVAGNTVLAKPASATPLIAGLVTRLLYESGVPESVLKLIPCRGEDVSEVLCLDQRLAGVAFTGSTQTARQINQQLSEKEGAIIPFIAETGGQNAMIVDSSSLPEQVVKDVMKSAFYCAGQRCSALRVLFLQDEIADEILNLLEAAMATLKLGDPGLLNIDIGPLIDKQSKYDLEHYCNAMTNQGHLLFKGPQLGDGTSHNSTNLLAPHVFEISSIRELNEEHFGPVLHVVRYHYKEIDQIVDDINGVGFGLTCGIHSRNEAWAKGLAKRLQVGNVYINRDMVGAIVGAQPFGGQGLSGTGFKAGGPNYLLRFLTEKTLTNNLSAIGGDVRLVAPQGKT